MKENENEKIKFLEFILKTLAHDLRGPISSIEHFADFSVSQMQEKNPDYELIKELISNIKDKSRETVDLLEKILEWSKSSLVEKEEFDLYKTSVEIISTYSFKIKDKGLMIKLDGDKSMIVNVNKNVFQLIFRNLFGNAIKFSHTGGKIKIVFEKQKDLSVVKIIDFGVGIPREKLDKIFVSGSFTLGTNNEKGSGVGLSLVNETVKNNPEFEVFADSEGDQKGSTFTIKIKK